MTTMENLQETTIARSNGTIADLYDLLPQIYGSQIHPWTNFATRAATRFILHTYEPSDVAVFQITLALVYCSVTAVFMCLYL